MIWFHGASEQIRTVAIPIVASTIDAVHSTIFTSHTLGHLVVHMNTMGMHDALHRQLIGVATMANKKALLVTLMDSIPPFDAR